MAEVSKVRVVRCPKCENLLPELADFSVYQCGGCGVVLRAKKKTPASAVLLEKSEGKTSGLGSNSETDRESDVIEANMGKERLFGEKPVNSIGNSSSKAENKEALIDNGTNVREEMKGLRLEPSGTGKEIRFFDRSTGLSKRLDDFWASRADQDMNMNMSEFANSSTGENLAQLRSLAGSSSSIANMEKWGMERDGFGGFYGNSRSVAERRGYQTFGYSNEGPSNCRPESFYGYGEGKKIGDDFDGPQRVERLEQNRAELLRKLDELKDQISRSIDVEDKPTIPVDRTPTDHYGGRGVYDVSMQPSALDKHVPRSNLTHEPVPSMNCHNMDMPRFYPPPRHAMSEFPAYEVPYQPQMARRPLHQPPSQYPQRLPHGYFPGQYTGYNQDPFVSYQPETFYHQPTCSCLRCSNQNWQVLPQVPTTLHGNRRNQKDPINSNFYRCDNLGPQGYNPQVANPPQLNSWDQRMYTRWPTDLDSDINGGQTLPRKVVAACRTRRLCHPIAGGAPFITCHNCFELLKLPRKLKTMEKNPYKLQCGGCSAIILFEIFKKQLIIPVTKEIKPLSAEAGESSELLNESRPSSYGQSNAGNTNTCSVDFDSPGYNFDLKDNVHNIASEDWGLNLSGSEKGQLLSSSSISSSEEESPNTVVVQGDVAFSAEQLTKDSLSPTLSGTPLQGPSYCPDHAEHSVSKYGQGNNSKRVDQDKMVLSRITSRQNSLKDVPVATEVEVLCNDYLNTDLSQESEEVTDEKDHSKISKGTDSIFMGFIKKSLREFSRSNQSLENERPNVFVNGQPIPDRLVKKAEKLAGKIQPGDYWYDFRAGFWGVMGHPCLGIIPPFIEEFKYPMPINCAGGNTGVYVNGRELNEKDLDLLASRGLPTIKEKYYTVEISGTVVDEDSGIELNGLGRLAPTVEKAKHGFGMKVPRSIIA